MGPGLLPSPHRLPRHGGRPQRSGSGMNWQSEMDELRRREEFAEELGGTERVKRQHDGGRLTIRERIARLVDPETFHELGKIAGSAHGNMSLRSRVVRLAWCNVNRSCIPRSADCRPNSVFTMIGKIEMITHTNTRDFMP